MKKSIFISLILLLSTLSSAQSQADKKYLLTTSTNTFGLFTLNLTDPYLSPLNYSGIGMRYTHESLRFLSLSNTNISIQNKYHFAAGYTLNPAKSALMNFLGTNYAWGLHYHFRSLKKLQLLAGGLWDIDFGYKMIARNINNPVNIDLATNFNLSGIAQYKIETRKKTYQMRLAVQSPILGCMFVPMGGASYYEMFGLGNLTNTTHFSSFHNKRGINGTLSLDVPFNYSTWRIGLNYQGLKYSANEMVFKRNELSLLIGTTFDLATFAGRKNKKPQNFLSTSE